MVNHHADRCRRQGVSIISGRNIVFENPLWENIGGTQPEAGLDAEPNTVSALAALFGIEGDPVDAFTARDIPYLQLAGSEEVSVTNHIASVSADRAAVIRLNAFERDLHRYDGTFPSVPHPPDPRTNLGKLDCRTWVLCRMEYMR